MTSPATSTAILLATETTEAPPQQTDVGALVVFVVLAVAIALLWFSMRSRLRRIRFEEEPDAPVAPEVEERSPDRE